MNKNILKVAMALVLTASPLISEAATILAGSDYFHTISAYSPAQGGINLISRPGGLNLNDSSIDTIMQRQGDCDVSLGGSCTVPLEMVGLSLQSPDGSIWAREDINRHSSGMLTINFLSLDNSNIPSGTFSSFFDVFYELSNDSGLSWIPMEAIGDKSFQLASSGTWSKNFSITGYTGTSGCNPLVTTHCDLSDPLHGHAHSLATPIPGAVWLFGSGLVGLMRFRKNASLVA